MSVRQYFIGLMSGTSMDGIDAALILFENNKTQLIATHSIDIPAQIKSNLLVLLRNEHIHLQLLGETDRQLGECYAQAVLQLLTKAKLKAKDIIAIGSHGQTIYHSPHGEHPFTMQIGDPNIIAAKTQITTIADFRRRDMALGGQGAPLVPAFHAFLLRDQKSEVRDQCVLNLGGIANISYIPKDLSQPIIGFDTGPANTLLDQWCEQHTKQPFDKDGEWARSGSVDTKLLAQLLSDDYFSKLFPKSTGREYFNLTWLNKRLKSFSNNISPADVQATLIELTAKTVADAIAHLPAHTLWVCGGGAYNAFLIERIQKHCKHFHIKSTSEMGIDPQWIEAAAFAWLAKQTIEGKPGNLPSVTGASQASILGSVFY